VPRSHTHAARNHIKLPLPAEGGQSREARGADDVDPRVLSPARWRDDDRVCECRVLRPRWAVPDVFADVAGKTTSRLRWLSPVPDPCRPTAAWHWPVPCTEHVPAISTKIDRQQRCKGRE